MKYDHARISQRPLRTPHAAAIAGGLITVFVIDPELFIDREIFLFGRAMVYKFNSVFAVRMAGMFTAVLGTIWFRNQLMPYQMVLFTILSAETLLIGISLYPWITLLFPLQVLMTIAYILVLNYRYDQERDGVTLDN